MILLGGCAHEASSTPRSSAPTRLGQSPPHSTLEQGDARPPEWQVVQTWSRTDPDASFGLADSKYVAAFTSTTSGGRVALTSREGHGILDLAAPAHGYVQDVWLGTYAVMEFIDVQARVVTLRAYGLSGETAWPVDLSSVNRSSPGPSVAYSEDRIAWTKGSPDDGMCVMLTDLESGVDREVDCAPKKTILDDIALDDQRVMFTRLTRPGSPTHRCKRVSVVDLDGRHDRPVERAIARQSDCLAWDAVPIGGGVAWDTADPNALDVARGEGYYVRNGVVTELGNVDTDSLVACGEMLFWTNPVREATTPFGWQPGSQQSNKVLELRHSRDESATALHCASNRYLSTRAEELSGTDEHLRLLVLDTMELKNGSG
ncbi:hypothetical protein [Nocardioides sp. MH1]|uniref:hypothetical protein n=1 Tax=Nocardioides sp. MH1 TaxID=3242490 RepID=UPI003522241D